MPGLDLDSHVDTITGIELFSCLRKDELKRAFHYTQYEIREYAKEQIIHLQHETCNTMDVILNGRVSVSNVDENGNILTIDTFSDRDIIGANLLFSSSNYYPMMVQALTGTVVLHIHRELVLKLCQNSVDFMVGFLKTVSDKSKLLTSKINAISLKTIREQIIDYLTYECRIQNSNVIKLKISKKELAERMGIQRTSLSRELNKMRKEGLLDYDSKTIIVMNGLKK